MRVIADREFRCFWVPNGMRTEALSEVEWLIFETILDGVPGMSAVAVHQAIYDNPYEINYYMTSQICVHICRLRQKIAPAEAYLGEPISRSRNGVAGYTISDKVVRLWDEVYHEAET